MTGSISKSLSIAGLLFVLGSLLLLLWWTLTLGGAKYEHMLQDVATGLRWVHDNREELHCPSQPSPKKLLFGGYSSGAHVAAVLLQRPDVLKGHGLPAPTAGLCDGVLFLSGLFATWDLLHLQKGVLGGPMRQSGFTDWVFRFTFGEHRVWSRDEYLTIPANNTSPLQDVARTPNLPHVMIGCESEVFGIDALDDAFGFVLCQDRYAAALKQIGIPVRASKVDSNHFGMFLDDRFMAMLRSELNRLVS
jgi:acetyl esterase/lipase